MTHQDAQDYSRKHPSGAKPDPRLAEAVRSRSKEGTVTCGAAFEIVAKEGVKPQAVGKTIDLVNVRVVRCQLGLFGYPGEGKALKPPPSVAPELERAIRKKLAEGRLPCVDAWEIAGELDLNKIEVSSAAEKLGIRIRPCQLGAF